MDRFKELLKYLQESSGHPGNDATVISVRTGNYATVITGMTCEFYS